MMLIDFYRLLRGWGASRPRAAWGALSLTITAWRYDRELRRDPMMQKGREA